MSQDQLQLPTLEQAAQVQESYYADFFFKKLAARNYAPRNQAEAETLLGLVVPLRQHAEQQIKAASEVNRFAGPANYVGQPAGYANADEDQFLLKLASDCVAQDENLQAAAIVTHQALVQQQQAQGQE